MKRGRIEVRDGDRNSETSSNFGMEGRVVALHVVSALMVRPVRAD